MYVGIRNSVDRNVSEHQSGHMLRTRYRLSYCFSVGNSLTVVRDGARIVPSADKFDYIVSDYSST